MSRLWPVLVLLAGCGQIRVTTKQPLPPGADALARRFVGLVVLGDTGRAVALLDPAMSGPRAAHALAIVTSTLAGRELDTLVAVRTGQVARAGRTFYSVDYQARTSREWVLFHVLVAQPPGAPPPSATHPPARGDGGYTIAGLQLTGLAQSLQQTNALTLEGKGPAHYLILLFGLASLLFILYTLVQVFRTPGVRRWLWAIVSLVAVGSLQLNWTTGQGNFVATAIILLGVSVGRPDLASPWIVQVGFPLGAALFYSRALIHPFWRVGRHRREEAAERESAAARAGAPEPPPPPP